MGASRLIATDQVYFGELYIYGTDASNNEVAFGKAQKLTVSDTYGFKGAMGPDSLTPCSVGVDGREVKLTVEHLQINPAAWAKLRGATAVSAALQADPSATLTLGASTGADGTWATTGFVAIGYSWVDPYGFETKIGGITTVEITSAVHHTAVTSISGAVPAGYSVNWYVSKVLKTTGPLAAAETLYWHSTGTGAGFNLLGFPTSTRTAPQVSMVSAARTVIPSYGNETPAIFTTRIWTPADASGLRGAFYGCLCPSLSLDIPLRDFVKQSVSLDVYGNGATPPKLYDWIMP